MVHIDADFFQFPMVSGLHLEGGVVYPLTMSGDAGVSGVAALLRDMPEAQSAAHLIPSFEVAAADGVCVLVGGGGSWEGEGFLALVDGATREARWVLYVQDSEEFVAATERQGVFQAVSGGYPERFEWEIHGGDQPLVQYKRANAA